MFDRLRQHRRPHPSTGIIVALAIDDQLQAARELIASERILKRPLAADVLAGDVDAVAALEAIEREVATARRLVDLAELAAEAARDEQEAADMAQRRQAAIEHYSRMLPGYRAEERDRRARLDAQIAQCRRSRDDRQAILLEELRDDPRNSRIPAPPAGFIDEAA